VKRRLFITGLFATGAIAAFADPTQARTRRRLRAGRRSRRTFASRRQSYQAARPTQYRPTAYREQRPRRSNNPGINRNLPEFWKNPGEIDRPIVAGMKEQDIRGMSKSDIVRKYGPPRMDEGSQLTWNVGRTSDGIIAPQTFTINLDSYGKATGFRRGF